MHATVKKWGNSASVRIPAAIMEAANLKLDEAVEITEVDGRIIIEPVRHKAFDLANLLDGITPDNRHGETDFGPAVGQEAF